MGKAVSTDLKRRARIIINRLKKAYPAPGTALEHRSALDLLVATILSAQCTDVRVNKVTPNLFSRYPSASDYAGADRSELEQLVRSTGFYRNKAKSIQSASQKIVERFSGDVPRTMDELLELPGVARKTANVVLGNYYGIAAGVVVDTHVHRLSHRMGLSHGNTAEQVERDLMVLYPAKDWIDLGNVLILHGRSVCSARQPKCEECIVGSYCPKIEVASKAKKTSRPSAKPHHPLSERIRSAKRKRRVHK
jgi:endonuclease-3